MISALTNNDSVLSTSLCIKFTVEPVPTDWLEDTKSTKPTLIDVDPIPDDVNLFLIIFLIANLIH